MTNLPRYSVLVAVLLGAAAESALAQIGPIQLVSASTAFNSDDWKQVTADCPPGTIAFSGGAQVDTSATAAIVIHQTLPVGDPPTSWTAVAQERTPTAETWRISARALCATVVGYEMVEAMSPLDSTSTRFIEVDCPPGKAPIGGGGGIFFFDSDLVVHSVDRTFTGWYAGAREVAPVAANWLLLVRVSCAPGLDLEWFRATSWQFFPESQTRLVTACPGQRVALAAAASAVGLGGETFAGFFENIPTNDGIGWQIETRRVAGVSDFPVVQELLCYLPIIFGDGFEAGDTGAWSGTAP